MKPRSTPPRRILLIRLSALGDVVMASGLVPALRSLYPDSELVWLTEAPSAPLIQHNPRLDDVIIWPRSLWQQHWRARRWRLLWQDIAAFRRLLRERQFDLVVDAHGLLKSGLCAWLTGAPRRVGLIAREGSHLLVHERVIPPAGNDPGMSSEYRFLARYLGASPQAFQLDLVVGDAPRATAQQALRDAAGGLPVAILCPFTTRPQKHWFEDRWVELAAALRGQGLVPVLLGGPADREASARMAAACPDLIDFTGRFKLDESAAIIAESDLLIGVDTGLTHMGTALRIPTIALFGSTRPYLETGSERTLVMYDALACSPCRRRPTCDGRFDCMRQFTVDRVLDTATHHWRQHGERAQP